MKPNWIDLRSDTVTTPTPEMLNAMFTAKVGDDVFGEDPTVNELEQYAADMFGMESALFCSSGTQTNQIAIKMHTQPGDEVICSDLAHVYMYEGGGIGFNSGCSARLLQGDRGRFTAAQVEGAINKDDVHFPVSRLVCIENTVNKGGGACWDFHELMHIREVCNNHHLAFHLDGARLFNAFVAKDENPRMYGQLFDSISICLSKGLGAPVGSLLLGSGAQIKKARRIRKVLGGGMRQAGFLAAAGLYALKNNVDRLATDHLHAQQIATVLEGCEWVESVMPAETNIVIFRLRESLPAERFITLINKEGIRANAMGNQQVRFVFHLHHTPEDIERLALCLKHVKE